MKKKDNGEGLLFDYNTVTRKQSTNLSAALFYQLFAGLVDKRYANALVENFYRFETDYRILTCEKNNADGTFQWDYPIGWACLQYIMPTE